MRTKIMGAQEQGAVHTDGRWLTVMRTLSFVLNGDDVLLMKRAAHKRIFPNRYNGVGGHVERDEDVFTSAYREIHEETGLAVERLHLCAIHNIDTAQATGITLFIFTAWSNHRSVIESDEGTLEWVSRDMIDRYDLVEDLAAVLPKVLALPQNAPPFYAHVSYDAQDKIQLRFKYET
jgi:8-oxo-dGTP diphosphatase